MNSHEIAEWMREEHSKVERLCDRLGEWVAIIPRTGLESWITEARARFEPLRAHFIRHMALEENGGYLVSVSEQRPTLQKNVERLRHEHHEFCRIMDGIQRELKDLRPEDPLLVRDFCNRINNLLGYIENHENAENLLVTLVFSCDIGTKD